MILLVSTTYFGCAAPGKYPPGVYPYKFELRNKEAAYAAVFDGFGSRIGSYYSIAQNSIDTTIALQLKSRMLTLELYQPEFELIHGGKRAGNEIDEFRNPSDIAPSVSPSGSFDRFYIADPGNNRIAVVSSRLNALAPFKLRGIENVSAIREISFGLYVVFSEVGNKICVINSEGELITARNRLNGKPLGRSIRIEFTYNRNILVSDPDNGRVLILDRQLEPMAEYISAGGSMFVRPTHAIMTGNRYYVLDQARSAISLLNRNGATEKEKILGELSLGEFILPLDFGVVVFTSDARMLFFNSELDFVKSVKCEHSFTAGYVTDGRRIVLVSRVERGIFEYRCTLRKTGERWGMQPN